MYKVAVEIDRVTRGYAMLCLSAVLLGLPIFTHLLAGQALNLSGGSPPETAYNYSLKLAAQA